jgi:hypothetical protein
LEVTCTWTSVVDTERNVRNLFNFRASLGRNADNEGVKNIRNTAALNFGIIVKLYVLYLYFLRYKKTSVMADDGFEF